MSIQYFNVLLFLMLNCLLLLLLYSGYRMNKCGQAKHSKANDYTQVLKAFGSFLLT